MMYPYIIDNRETTEQEYIDNVFSQEKGDVFKYNPKNLKFEEVLHFLDKYKPDTIEVFAVEYIAPGTRLYTIHKDSTIAIIDKITS